MSILTPPTPMALPLPIYRIPVAQFHEMIEKGIFKDGDRIELVEGLLVAKTTKHNPHIFATQALGERLLRMLSPGWFVNNQEPVTTSDSEPEPDLSVIRGDRRQFADHKPGPSDLGLVVEVSESSLSFDRGAKRRVYARANAGRYWIVNLVDRRVEVYTDPSGPCDEPAYRQQQDYPAGAEVPVVLDGLEVGRVLVNDLLL